MREVVKQRKKEYEERQNGRSFCQCLLSILSAPCRIFCIEGKKKKKLRRKSTENPLRTPTPDQLEASLLDEAIWREVLRDADQLKQENDALKREIERLGSTHSVFIGKEARGEDTEERTREEERGDIDQERTREEERGDIEERTREEERGDIEERTRDEERGDIDQERRRDEERGGDIEEERRREEERHLAVREWQRRTYLSDVQRGRAPPSSSAGGALRQ